MPPNSTPPSPPLPPPSPLERRILALARTVTPLARLLFALEQRVLQPPQPPNSAHFRDNVYLVVEAIPATQDLLLGMLEMCVDIVEEGAGEGEGEGQGEGAGDMQRQMLQRQTLWLESMVRCCRSLCMVVAVLVVMMQEGEEGEEEEEEEG
ncbi:hypothetical protein EDC01DRAFT_631778 [Geopyxis carbonaria]|nr:hypothetical protein EDC01DRAFT_631778 [Geopyxis carbonaria]